MARKQLINKIEKARREERKLERQKELEEEQAAAAQSQEGAEPQAEDAEVAEVKEEGEPKGKKGKGKDEEAETAKPVKDLVLPGYSAKPKPELTKDVKKALKYRAEKKSKQPYFVRQEAHLYKRVGMTWRKPRGIHSKARQHWGYRVNVVSIGYRGPKDARGLHPSGFKEVIVHNVKDLEAVDHKKEAVKIAKTVGYKKRLAIMERVKEMQKKKDVVIYVLNPPVDFDRVTVWQPSDLEKLDRSVQAAVIAPSVGKQMRKAIIARAKEMSESGKGKVRILNAMREMTE